MLERLKAVIRPQSAAQRQKIIILLALFFTLVSVVVLAGSLDALSLQAGTPFSLSRPTDPSGGTLFPSEWMQYLLRAMLILMLLLLPFALIYLLFTKEGRRQLVPMLIMFMAALLLLSLIKPNDEVSEQAVKEETPIAEEAIPSADLVEAPVVAYDEEPPDWITPLVIAVITLILFGLGVVIYRLVRSEQRTVSLSQVAQEAQEALEDLEAGGDLRQIIIRCYREMGKTVSRSQGIQRGSSVTAHEFEAVLTSRGLPQEPVHGLTALFERVRYSDLPAQEAEKMQAIACLRHIVAACKVLEAEQRLAQEQEAKRQAALLKKATAKEVDL